MDQDLLDGFFLGEFFVEPVTGNVTAPDSTTHLASRSMEVLLVLASTPRELISRRSLLDEVWGKDQGSPDALSHAIGEIRQALGDNRTQPHFVQTVPRRGYRLLVAPRREASLQDYHTPVTPGRTLPVFSTLMRHGVIQSVVAYLIFGWLLIQIADATFFNLGLPDWAEPFITFAVIGGLPIVALLAWFLEQVEGRMVIDQGDQNSSILASLGRNYIPIVAAYALAIAGAASYQTLVGFRVESPPVIVQPAVETAPPIPVEPNSVAMLQLMNIDGSEATQVFSNGLSEDVLDRLAKIPGLLVPSRGDSWSVPVNSSSDIIRRRLRVAYFVEGSVRLVDDHIRVVIQLIDSSTGFHLLSRSFDREVENFLTLQTTITELIVASLRASLPEAPDYIAELESSHENLNAYVLYRRGRDTFIAEPSAAAAQAALDYFAQALAVDPEYAAAHAGNCTAYTSLFSYTSVPDYIEQAEQSCRRALSANPRLHVVHDALGQLYTKTGRLIEAEAAFLNSLRGHPNGATAMTGLAMVYARQNRVQEAEELYLQAVKTQPGNRNSLDHHGGFLFKQGRFKDAADAYRKAAFLEPDNWASLSNLGSALIMSGDFPAARIATEQALEINRTDSLLSNLGIIHYYEGRFEQAAEVLRQVLDMSPGISTTWTNLGDALYFAGEQGKARDMYAVAAKLSTTVLSVNPGDTLTRGELAWVEQISGKPEEANFHVRQLQQTTLSDPYTHYYIALVYTYQDDTDKALSSLEKAVEAGYPIELLLAEPHLQRLHQSPLFTAWFERRQAG
jgi:tetratricopeptide (TPR) repeat protein/DNA-binding winged helix-turn-helix (wHTH) protein